MGCLPGGNKHSSKVEPLDKPGVVGLSKDRGCTDILCSLLIFPAFLGGMGYTAYIAWDTGDPYSLYYGRDSWGNTCHRNNTAIAGVPLSGRDMTGLQKMFYFNPDDIMDTADLIEDSERVCVKKCPPGNLTSISMLQSFYNSEGISYCEYDVLPTAFTNGGDCPDLPVTEHYDLVNRCIPKSYIKATAGLAGAAADAIIAKVQPHCEKEGDFFSVAAGDLEIVWKEILYLCAIATGVAFVVTLLMGLIATVVIWTLLVATVVGCLAGAGFCWWHWYSYKTALDAIAEADQSTDDKNKVQMWLIVSSIVSGVAGIILLIILVLRKRILLVISLFKEAAKAMRNMPMLLLQPVWTLLALVIILSGILYVFAFVITAGDPDVDSRTGFVEFKADTVLFYMRWYYILGILWWIQFLYACEQMVIAASVVIWYFRYDKTKLGWPIVRAHGIVARYHLGTLLFGSLLIALVQLARLILEYIERMIKWKTNKCTECLLKCLKCCLWCFEKVLKYINTNAYIMTAIHGHNFCRAAWAALAVLIANVLRVAALNSVGVFVLFLGKCGVVASAVVIGMETFFKDREDICYVWVPLLVTGIFSYFIAHCFLTTYSMAIDTIFMCFCEDCSENDGISKPYYMSRDLMEFVDNSAEALRNDKKRKKAPKPAKNQVQTMDQV